MVRRDPQIAIPTHVAMDDGRWTMAKTIIPMAEVDNSRNKGLKTCRTWIAMLVAMLLGCGNAAVSPDDDVLSQVMALSNVNKAPITQTDGSIVGLTVSADVINTGPVPIEQAFVMTWRLREGNATLSAATHRFSGIFDRSERRRVVLTLNFPARPNLSGVQDVVTFEFD